MSQQQSIGSFKKVDPILGMFDIEMSTVPSFSLNRCLLRSFIETDFIKVVRNNGTTYPSEYFGFGKDMRLPVTDIVSFAGGDNAHLEVVKCHNTADYYEQLDIDKMPIIVTGGAIVRDSLLPVGRIGAKYDGVDDVMVMPNSQSKFKMLHNGTVCSQIVEYEWNGVTGAQALFGTGAQANGQVGWIMEVNRFQSPDINILVRNPGTTLKVTSFNNPIVANTAHTIFNTMDITNATAERVRMYIDGVLTKSNTTADASTPADVNSNNNMQMGLFATEEARGIINSGIFYQNNQEANRELLLSYLQ